MEHRRPPPEIAVLNAVAEAHRLFSDLVVRLRERRDVREVVRILHVAPGPSIDLYTDAELHNREAVSWGVEAVFSDGEWTITSSLRRNHARGQDEVRGLPTRSALTAEEFEVELVGAARMATEVWSESVPMFRDEGYGG